ncbi:hypothetical protein FGO68_gene5565 [Halteria grandinella]|uniref:Uncharacterized protein n=1 Tax=Halteria grandinella TaxID=5974 RepID=A0A8J8P477_HALGN|nr:hypothetical protein FGO68_gene5565 [Halteria grandinella]
MERISIDFTFYKRMVNNQASKYFGIIEECIFKKAHIASLYLFLVTRKRHSARLKSHSNNTLISERIRFSPGIHHRGDYKNIQVSAFPYFVRTSFLSAQSIDRKRFYIRLVGCLIPKSFCMCLLHSSDFVVLVIDKVLISAQDFLTLELQQVNSINLKCIAKPNQMLFA